MRGRRGAPADRCRPWAVRRRGTDPSARRAVPLRPTQRDTGLRATPRRCVDHGGDALVALQDWRRCTPGNPARTSVAAPAQVVGEQRGDALHRTPRSARSSHSNGVPVGRRSAGIASSPRQVFGGAAQGRGDHAERWQVRQRGAHAALQLAHRVTARRAAPDSSAARSRIRGLQPRGLDLVAQPLVGELVVVLAVAAGDHVVAIGASAQAIGSSHAVAHLLEVSRALDRIGHGREEDVGIADASRARRWRRCLRSPRLHNPT